MAWPRCSQCDRPAVYVHILLGPLCGIHAEEARQEAERVAPKEVQ